MRCLNEIIEKLTDGADRNDEDEQGNQTGHRTNLLSCVTRATTKITTENQMFQHEFLYTFD